MLFSNLIKKNPQKFWIASSVVCLHLILITKFSKTAKPIGFSPAKKHSVHVRTIEIAPSKPAEPIVKKPSELIVKKAPEVIVKKTAVPQAVKKQTPIQKIQPKEMPVPKKIESTSTFVEKESKDYKMILLEYLQNTLTLPEEGEVELQIKLYPDGKVHDIQILQSSSYTNECFLKKEIQRLQFPPLVKDDSKKNIETFILLFRSKMEVAP